MRPRREITPLDRMFLLSDAHDRPIQDHTLIAQDWYAKPHDFRFVLERSPIPWQILTMVGHEITLHADVDYWKE
ncbi:MAG TPA: hypothetical protein VF881_03460 [Polyangiaceae bacterium]